MASDEQKKDINPTGGPSKLPSFIFKRPLDVTNVPPQPPKKFPKVKFITIPNQSAALLQKKKTIPTQPLVQCPKVRVLPVVSAVGIDNDSEEIDVVAVEPERGPNFRVKVLPVKAQIPYGLKLPNLQHEMPGTSAAASSSSAMANSNNKAYTFFNFDELRRRTNSAYARRGLGGPTDKSLELLSLAAYDFLKEIVEQVTAVARCRIEGAPNKQQQAVIKEERQKIEFLNELQSYLEARDSKAEENPNKADAKGAEEKRMHREFKIQSTNETAMAAIGGRRCLTITKVNKKPKIVTQVQMKDCLFFMENNAMFCKSELLYVNSLKYT